MANKIKVVDSQQQKVINILVNLSPVQMSVLIKRFHEGKTQDQVGDEMKVTGERIRQVEVEALRVIDDNLI